LLALAVCVLKSQPEYRYWPRMYRNSCSPLDGESLKFGGVAKRCWKNHDPTWS
jgi:hypothetical protein